MIRSPRGLLLVAILTLVVGLIVLFPARIAYQWASPPHVALSGITGTVWSGGADALETNGIVFRNISWTARPLRLLTGRLVFRVNAAPVSGFIEGDVFVGVGRTVDLWADDLRASLPLQLFAAPLNMPGMTGNTSLQFERIELRDGMPVKLDGTVDIADLVAPGVNRNSIGGYRVEFFSQADGISASVEDTDGVLDIAGSLQLRSDRSYQLLTQVVAKPSAPEELRRRIERLPAADDRSKRELRIEGSL